MFFFQKKKTPLLVVGFALAFARFAHAQDATLAVPGYTGLLTVPSALMMPEGSAELSYGNALDKRFSAQTMHSRNLSAGFGFFDWLEVGGRLAEYLPPGGGKLENGFDRLVLRDLSANVKAKIPLNVKWLPELAVGISDIGGGAPQYKSRYGVGTIRPLESVRVTAGYGFGPQRLDGLFGGIEWQVFERALLLADYDGRDKYIGARVYSPPIEILNHAQLIGTVMRSVKAKGEIAGTTFDRTEFSVGLQIPLSRSYESTPQPVAFRPTAPRYVSADALVTPRVVSDVVQSASPPVKSQPNSAQQNQSLERALIADNSKTNDPVAKPSAVGKVLSFFDVKPAASASFIEGHESVLRELQGLLVKQGFERVRVGELGGDLIVEFENNRYNLNDADGAGIVLGLAANCPTKHQRVIALQKKVGLGFYEYRVGKTEFQQFVNGKGVGIVEDTFAFDRRQSYDSNSVAWVEEGRATGRAYLRLKLNPRLSTFYGTEYGAVDYSLGLATTQSYPLWSGAEWNSTYVSPLTNSTNFKEFAPFGFLRIREGFEANYFTQSYWLSKYVFNSTSIGQFEYDYRGVQHQSVAFLPYWDHAIRFSRVSMQNKVYSLEPRRDAGSVSYRAKLPFFDAWVEVAQHTFQGGDKGQVVDFTRFYGDVSLGARYRKSDVNEKYVGFVVGVPLTLREEFKPGLMQLVGPARFVHSINTKLVSEGGRNDILFNAAALQSYAYDQTGIFLNKGRFSEQYMKGQLGRMRNAYSNYVRLENTVEK